MQHGRSSAAERLCALVLYLLALLWAVSAHAEELGNRQNLVFSAERLFGFYIDNQSLDHGNRSDSIHHTVLGVGWADAPTSLAMPKLGIDYFLTNALTLGGNLGFFSRTDAGTTTTGVLVGVRVGYAFRLGHAVALWPRAGFSFTSIDVENADHGSHLFAMTLEAPFAFALTEGFAITAGPALDLGFAGKQVGTDYSELLFGLMIGLSGWIGL